MKNVVIAGYARSPFTPAFKGELAGVRPDELVAQVITALVHESGIDPNDIEDLILGCAFPEGEQGLNLARLVGHLAQLPVSIAGVTVNRFCGSSMQAIHIAAGAIQMNAGDAFICAGVESMSREPMGGFNMLPHPDLYRNYPQAYIGMGETAENLALNYHIARVDQEAFALTSQHKAYAAQQQGLLVDEIIPIVTGKGQTVTQDGCLRPDSTAEGLAELKSAFLLNGSVTAGTSSPLTDGAAAVLVCSEAYADKHGLNKLARIKSIAVSGCLPEIMGIGPVAATQKALYRAGLSLVDIDIVELNEAFAAQALAVLKELPIPAKKLNLDGGAIALGHPLGASGARITGKAASLLQRENKQYALATQCIGGGQGIATILEAVS
ncbi:MAG: thiolase family protein [Methylococcaceae bacterium]|nr:thiolase family protein [Methylococcaceae bacterium]MDZ4155083.1 thiolase family protein [Methylococcales bacterium]MDP2394472.1 thiolase family protein [Methylococcaceae bacterium]MDP3021515.1 thiolase family protein [Methylococcaceae bacterium]MDP3390366.1 thiolase family protein [Methylococcaceae bacterium]